MMRLTPPEMVGLEDI